MAALKYWDGFAWKVLGAPISTATADVSFGGYKATLLGNPTNAQDAATKAYVDLGIIPLVTSLPTSGLTEGMVVAYQNAAMATAGVTWLLRYRSAGGTYPWDFVGGAPLYTAADPARSTTSLTYVAPATDPLSLTTPLAGIYDITYEAQVAEGTQAISSVYGSYVVAGSTQAQMDAWGLAHAVSGGGDSDSKTHRHSQGIAAGTAIAERIRMDTGAGNAQVAYRRMRLLPVRVV